MQISVKYVEKILCIISRDKRDINYAIEAVEEKCVHADIEHFHAIERSSSQSIYSLARQIKWSMGEIYESARRLENVGMIRIQKATQNSREVFVLDLPTWHESLKEYFTPEDLEEMRKPGFMDEVEDIIEND